MSKQVTPEQVEGLFEQQLSVWPMAKGNFEALKTVKVKELDVDGRRVKVQFNPARIVSSGAKVDAKSLKERKCFLCAENRPDVQEGIDWNDRYTILINPFPIFPRHLTIPNKAHELQLIKGRMADMIDLARTLEGYTVFYNGPKCGASAPDHMHFQAGNSDFLTVAQNIDEGTAKPIIASANGDASLSVFDMFPTRGFVIDAKTAAAGEEMFDRLYDAIPVPDGEAEPMMNILAWHDAGNDSVRVVVIPRKRHRPSFYGTEGEGTMLLSPASVDMGGVFITPLEKDFNALDADKLRQVIDELCLNKEEVDQIAKNIK